jgi:hypothetical protein
MSDRTATISRKTNETEIEVYINLDCQPGSASTQTINVSTGIGFLDHVCAPPKPCIHSQRDQHDPTYRCTTPLRSTAECLSRSRPRVTSGSTTIIQLISPHPPSPISVVTTRMSALIPPRAHTGHGDCAWHRVQTGAR